MSNKNRERRIRDLTEKEFLDVLAKGRPNYGTAGAPLASNSKEVVSRPVEANENKTTLTGLVSFNEDKFDISSIFNSKKRLREADMRKLSDECIPIRNCIEHMKSKVARATWTVIDKASQKSNRQCKEVISFLEYPDGQTDFDSFIGQVIEEIFVVGKVAISPEKNVFDKLLSLNLIDSATIKPIVDYRGIVSKEGIAYQQKYHNKVVNLKFNELVYFEKTKRVHKRGTFSIVEQLFKVGTLFNLIENDISLYFTDGNVPYTIASVKNVKSIKELDAVAAHFEEQVSTNKNLLKFFPEAEFHKLKDTNLKSDLLDYLVRIICASFKIPYAAYVAEVNRATAETSKNISDEDGLLDLLDYLQNIINFIIKFQFGYEGIQFKWNVDVQVDPNQQATRLKTLVDGNIITVNEAREELGYEALPEDEVDSPDDGGGTPPGNDGQDDQAQDKGQEADKTEKSELDRFEKSQHFEKLVAQENPAVVEAQNLAEKAYSKVFKGLLEDQQEAILEALHYGLEINESLLKSLELTDSQIEKFFDDFEEVGKSLALLVLDKTYDEFNVVSARAFESTVASINQYFQQRAGDLIGKKLVDGAWIDNPNQKYAITKTTRDSAKKLIGKAVQEGWSTDKLAKAFQSEHLFSSSRSATIARTETIGVSASTAMSSLINAGFKKKLWVRVDSKETCEDCVMNEAHGAVDIDSTFPSGAFAPPDHPNCKCIVRPQLDSQ